MLVAEVLPVLRAVFAPPEATSYAELAVELSGLITPAVEVSWASPDSTGWKLPAAPDTELASIDVTLLDRYSGVALLTLVIERPAGTSLNVARFRRIDSDIWLFDGFAG